MAVLFMDRQGPLCWKALTGTPSSECRTPCVCMRAFRTTSASSLHVEANELPLQLMSQKLAHPYIVKLKSNPGNPAYSSVFQPNYTTLFDAKPNVIPHPWATT
jgi:hypothetical protein